MNLFRVFDTKKNSYVQEGFKTRKAAKAARDKLNSDRDPKNPDSMPRHIVSRGPDHWRGES